MAGQIYRNVFEGYAACTWLLKNAKRFFPEIQSRVAALRVYQRMMDEGMIEAVTGDSPSYFTDGGVLFARVIQEVDDNVRADISRHATLAEVQQAIPALARLAGNIGDPAVRNRGTLGGSIANHDPAADYPAAVIALGATVQTSKRAIPAEEFFTGMFETALEDDEIVTSVSFPLPEAAAYMKFENPASRYAIVGVFVAKTGGEVRVGVTGATGCAHRGLRLEAALGGELDAGGIDAVELPVEQMNSDIHASAEYRAHLVKVMTKRAVEACQ